MPSSIEKDPQEGHQEKHHTQLPPQPIINHHILA